ncbi:MAG: hypothetical protein K0S27_356 [Gammaproteobacteria bacterium]|jgi:hypothetical protein|nr:hypothetical protein [Gammaproteobacteria bacterium]
MGLFRLLQEFSLGKERGGVFASYSQKHKVKFMEDIRKREEEYINSLRSQKEVKESNKKAREAAKKANSLERNIPLVPPLTDKPKYGSDEREFIRQYISEQVKKAKTIDELNEIFSEHSDRLYVKQHRRAEPIDQYRKYTKTKIHLINALRKRAEEIFTLPTAEAELTSSYPIGEEEHKAHDVLNNKYPKGFLSMLLDYEIKLKNAPFNDKCHDSWASRSIGGVVKSLLRPLHWLYRPAVYTKEQKAQVRAHLLKEIDKVNDIQALLALCNLYQHANFVTETRSRTSLFTRSYSTTRIEFLNTARKKADALMQDEGIDLDRAKILLDHDIFSERHEKHGVHSFPRIKLKQVYSDHCAKQERDAIREAGAVAVA